MATYQYIGWNNPDGAIIGGASSKLGFFNTSPVVQQTTFSSVSTTASISVAGSACFGFASSDQANAVVTAINNIRTAIRNLGFVA